MSSFTYTDGQLGASGVMLSQIADSVPTPFYAYDLPAIRAAYQALDSALGAALGDLPYSIHYALKANDNPAVVRALGALGAGADIVSAGELEKSLAAGIPADRTVFAGVGKTKREMRTALEADILQFNVESEPELLALEKVAAELGVVAPVALRVNPDVDAGTIEQITTGRADNKFGIDIPTCKALVDRCAVSDHLSLDALAIHIGSQLTDLEPYRLSFFRLKKLAQEIDSLKRIDLGGGIGITYNEEITIPAADYAALVAEVFSPLGLPLMFEPGRSLVANAGAMVSQVLYVKPGAARDFLILDAAMNDLIRPALYDAFHRIRPLNEAAADAPVHRYDVVGPVCESTDRFAKDRALPALKEDDLVAFDSAGAYCAVMACTYNGRPLPDEVIIDAKLPGGWAVTSN